MGKKFNTLLDQLPQKNTEDKRAIHWSSISPINDFIEVLGVHEIVDSVKNDSPKEAKSIVNSLMQRCFHEELAIELFNLAQKHPDIKIKLPLAERVACWIQSKSPPNVELAKLLLQSEDVKINTIGANWVLVMFDYEPEILQIMMEPEHEDILKIGKTWFQKIKGGLGTYRIKKTGNNLDVIYDGKKVSSEKLSKSVESELLSIPYDLVLQVRQFIVSVENGEQLIVEDIEQIADNNLQHVYANVEKRMGLLDVLSGAMGWNNLDGAIINHKVFYEAME